MSKNYTNMIREAYVTFETAKLLKEKGFSEPCHKTYDITTHDKGNFSHCGNHGLISSLISAPTHPMALAWLTSVHGLFISVCPDINDKLCFYSDIYKKGEYCWTQIDYNLDGYTTPEEAVEAALKYSLENLI